MDLDTLHSIADIIHADAMDVAEYALTPPVDGAEAFTAGYLASMTDMETRIRELIKKKETENE